MAVKSANIKAFINKWSGKGREDEDDRSYWIDLLQDVFELTGVTSRIEFQKKVIGPDGNTKRIDAYIPETHVLIEQKSLPIQLDKPQASHNGMTPYEQAKMYDNSLPRSEKARWIITSNFAEIWIYDMDTKKPEDSVLKIDLENLDKDYKKLAIIYDPQIEQINKELEISQGAGEQIGRIYDALIKLYPNDPTEADLKNLNTFCVRLVFCYYAEDAGLFDEGIFKRYIESFNYHHLRNGLKDLFRVLNTKESERDPFEEESLLAFPYVNGGLFADSNLVIPQINEEIKNILISASDFDWSEISPTIFGAIFESTLNQETRHSGGMHYTSIDNIHKVIDPLFLNDLREELETIKDSKQPNVRVSKLRELQDKMASLKFFDPACGSGNFLTETYLSLRNLENDIISTINRDQIAFADLNNNPIKIKLSQFYGIEINDFAVSVAKTALWIAENQMMNKTKAIIYNADSLNFLPLKSYTNIVEGNALTIDWNEVLPCNECSYIMGNPPFLGANSISKTQKNELLALCGDDIEKGGLLDYVSGWYIKTSRFIQGTNIKAAFVSTNSITQGEQVAIFWKPLIEKYGIILNYAYRTFRWDSEATIKAHVHCVIIGFSTSNSKENRIFSLNGVEKVNNISPYLIDSPNVFIDRRKKPICAVPEITKGCQPTDGGNLIIEADEYEEFIKKEPNAKKYIKKLVGAKEYINNLDRWCLWLVDASPKELRTMPLVMDRIEKCKEMRLNSTDKATRKLAETPSLFRETYNPETFIIVPSASSENRDYIPLGFLGKDVISTNANLIIPNADLFHFGILTSSVHMAWMRIVCGRLKSDYRYSKDIVYNNYPWPSISDEQQRKIEQTAQMIIDARKLYPDSSLADLYDPLTMPPELIKAHRENDKAVMKVYGFDSGMSETDIVARLMKMHQNLTIKK